MGTTLKLARLIRYARSRANLPETANSEKWRYISHLAIQALGKAVAGELAPGHLAALDKHFEQYALDERNDGSADSGNWGHKGVPGQLGGSAPGGGIAHRTGSKESGYSSAAKERAKAKAQSSAKGQTEESSASGNVKLAHTSYKVGEFSQNQQKLIESTFENLKKTYPISDADLPIVQGVREKYGLPYDYEDWEVEDKLYEMGIRDPYATSADGLYTLKDGRMELTLGAGLFTGTGTGDSMRDSFEYIHKKGLKLTGNTDQAGFGPEYVLTHEYGHLLAHSVGIYGSQKNVKPLAEYYRKNKEKVRREISGYATQNWNEMFAEAFAQSFSPYQSEASKEIMSIYEQALNKERKADSGLGAKGGSWIGH